MFTFYTKELYKKKGKKNENTKLGSCRKVMMGSALTRKIKDI